ncbi:MAG TPA: hypothetical protein DEA08_27385 [Planctomycetes bacterium]|nr:hypothetical protein [Planctomycetota bacterium]
MTDSVLRDLERQFRSSGSSEHEAAWLRARVQSGDLDEGRLELAGALGHSAAQIAGFPESERTSWGRWVDFADRSAEAQVLVVLALAAEVRPAFEAGEALLGAPDLFDQGARALENWLREGSEESLSAIAALLPQLQNRAPALYHHFGSSEEESERGRRAQDALQVVRCGAELLLDQHDALPAGYEIDFEEGDWGDNAELSVRYLWHEVAQQALTPNPGRFRVPETETRLLDSIRDRVMPWALGYDPRQVRASGD